MLPYGLKSRADRLADTVVPDDLTAAGADATGVARLQEAVTAFQTAAGDFGRARFDRGIRLRRRERVAARHPEAGQPGTDRPVALAEHDFYPHEQVLLDVQCLNDALEALETSDTGAALAALEGVDLTSYGLGVSHECTPIC